LRGGCRQGRNSIWYCVNRMPQKETLDKAAYTCLLLVSYRRLSAQFQFSLSADTLGYLSQWYPRLCCRGKTDSPGGEGDGGSIFWKTREIGLPSYSMYSVGSAYNSAFSRRPTRNTCCTREGSIRQLDSIILLNRMKQYSFQ
jgi:hypothetical protein